MEQLYSGKVGFTLFSCQKNKKNDQMKLNKILPIILIPLIVIVCVCIVGSYVNHTQNRLYFSITAFDLPQSNSFTVGENSDVCYKGVPEEYMTVHYSDSIYSYKINNQDSCLYYFVNNKNPNNHILNENSDVQIFSQHYSGGEIINLLKEVDNKYNMLKDVLKDKINSDTLTAIEKGEKYFESFVFKDDNKYSIVILDKTTKINGLSYCFSDTLPTSDDFKLQFFKMSSWSVRKNDDKYFHDSIRSYFAKPVQMFTEWGAGHIKVTRKDNTFSVTFPKAITTTIPTKTIHETAEKSETGVYLKQLLKSYPMPTDFYIPAFSNALSEYVCELSAKDNNLIFQETSKRDTVQLATSGNFIPKIKVAKQQLVTGGITYKVRILDKGFYLSKHKLLFVAWLLLSILLFLSFPFGGFTNSDDKNKKYDAVYYIIGMFTLFWFFLNQKLLIAEKLTFTYPYFEKIYPVSYLTTLFSLFAMFLLIILINRAYFNNKNLQYLNPLKLPQFLQFKKIEKIPVQIKFTTITRITLTILILVVTSCATGKIYNSFIAPIEESYIADDVLGLWKIWRWQKIDLLNDNHFTVFMIVGCLLAALLFVFLVSDSLAKFIKRINKNPFIKQKALAFKQKIRNFYKSIRQKLLSKQNKITDKLKQLSWFNGKIKCVFKFIKRYAKIILIFIAYIALAVIIGILGNFGTALAVLILLFSLSAFFQKQIEKSHNKSFGWLFISLVISCCFVIIGMSDNGFFINIFGIVFCWIVLMLSATKYYEKKKRWNNFAGLLVLGMGICILAVVGAKVFLSNPEKIDYGRSTRRVENCIDPDKVKEAGYLYTESDMQWMEVMRHYAEKVNAGKGDDYDIYSEDNNFHQLVSSGQSPVILNDVSVPAVYLGSLRGWGWFGLLFGVLALGVFIYWFSIGDTWREKPQNFTINRQLIGRLLAGNLWIGVTLYLLVSYYWFVPFTGRLIPGFGVDAVGEALEIIVLFAFMCALCNPLKSNKTN